MSTRQIADRLGTDRPRIQYIKSLLGLRAPEPPSDEVLARLYGELGTVAKVAAQIRFSTHTTSRLLKKAGVTVIRQGGNGPGSAPRRLHRLDVHLAEITAAYVDNHVSAPELAVKYDTTAPAMHNYLQSRQVYRSRRLTDADHERIQELAARGVSPGTIAEALGVSLVTIRKHRHSPPQRTRATGLTRVSQLQLVLPASS